MRQLKWVIVFLIPILAVGFYLMGNNKALGFKGTKVLNLVSNAKTATDSDFLFETVNHKKIELDVADRVFKIKGMENKTVFLKVFGWDCKYCKKEIPQLVKLKDRLGDAFEVIAIEAQNHTNEESLKQIKAYGINYPIVSGASHSKFYAYLQKKYGWEGIIPLTIVIGKEGKVLAFEVGAKSYSLAELMKAALSREGS